MVYVLTNQTTGNAVAMFRRADNGLLEAAGAAPTGGLGTGSGIGSQGAVVLSDNGRWLLAVNPGSDDVSVFAVTSHGLALTDRVSSGGVRPISITLHKDLMYVLNAGAAGNITGFRLDRHGRLSPLANSTRPLSNNGVGDAPGPAQVAFSPDGDMLIVTEKATNLLLAYIVGREGLATGPVVQPAAGVTPFGFAFTRQGTLVVSEAFGGAPNASAVSSYAVNHGSIQTVSASVPTGQTAACWIAVSKNGKFAYSTNAGSGSVSAYAVQRDGSLTLIDGRAGVTGDGTGPIDVMVSHNGQYLYVLNGRVPSIAIFAIQDDGLLTPLGSMSGLPAGAVGMAAW
jgi:6-phosphogluconolactonase (cycloisomerase 2 family)